MANDPIYNVYRYDSHVFRGTFDQCVRYVKNAYNVLLIGDMRKYGIKLKLDAKELTNG